MLKHEKEQRQEVQRFFNILQQHYKGSIELFYINRDRLLEKNTRKSRIKFAEIPIQEAYRVLMQENAIWKNYKRQESVYWSYGQSNNLTLAFVDDITDIDRFKQEDQFLLMQTSQHKYQAYFLLDKPVNSQQLYQIQKHLVNEYKGDTGALGWAHLKRVAGFRNTKYEDNYIVKVVHIGSRVIKTAQIKPVVARKQPHSTNYPHRTKNERNSANMKQWQDFYTGDKSAADISYTLYLLSRGYTPVEIEQKLLQESPDIQTRHKLSDYIPRTIAKAQDYITQ